MWYTAIIPVLMRLRWEDYKFEVGLGYIARSCPPNKNKNKANKM